MSPTSQDVQELGKDSLRSAVGTVKRGWILILVSTLVVGIGGLIYSLLQSPVYRSTATLYVTSGNEANAQTAYQGSLASQQRVTSYIKLVDSDGVVAPAIGAGGVPLSLSDAKAALSATTTPETVLLNVSAESTNRQTAADLANAVAESMTTYVQRLETPAGGRTPLAKLTVVTPAGASDTPISPRTKRNTALALVIGLLAGIAVVFVRDRYDNKVHDEDEVQDITDAPVLASVPSDGLLKERGLIDFSSGATLAAESYRKLRTNLSFTSVDRPFRRIIVTSALEAEGKTTTAINLAAALAETGQRVVLVDADLRRPQVNHRTGRMGDVGFTNYLKGDGGMNDLLQPTDVENFWVLASGPKPPNPAELLGSKRAGEGIEELSAHFDYVIIDTPPLLPVTDAAVIARWADGVLLVARANQTRLPNIASSIEQLDAVQATLIGLVLTDVPTRGGAYKYGYTYGATPETKSGPFSRFRRKPKHKAIETVLDPNAEG
ncbi:polysaccharide biosynthesis tyrosine autokinase [Williamsia muralis]|uniref:polysaccharide biosynthesis tyrosine autokinase n=1 Tax=Williamsia marianensis TaxID=85044 RepID=UPI000DE5F9AB|nr:polysaccharide biosynthesis tyrosine autokinase [Williamsia marianensis]PVY26688.1 capsular exopolysaccharide synthesis family protein [Williamsia marianensis]